MIYWQAGGLRIVICVLYAGRPADKRVHKKYKQTKILRVIGTFEESQRYFVEIFEVEAPSVTGSVRVRCVSLNIGR